MKEAIPNYDDEGFTARYLEAHRKNNERLKKLINTAFYDLLRAYRSDGLSTGAAAQAAVDGLNKAMRQ